MRDLLPGKTRVIQFIVRNNVIVHFNLMIFILAISSDSLQGRGFFCLRFYSSLAGFFRAAQGRFFAYGNITTKYYRAKYLFILFFASFLMLKL